MVVNDASLAPPTKTTYLSGKTPHGKPPSDHEAEVDVKSVEHHRPKIADIARLKAMSIAGKY